MFGIKVAVVIFIVFTIFYIRTGLIMMRTRQSHSFEGHRYGPDVRYLGTRKGKAVYYEGLNIVVHGLISMLGLALITWAIFINGAITTILVTGVAIWIMGFFIRKPIANLVIAQLRRRDAK